jgi:carboxypeptidase C (cathepsin A)
MKRALTGLLSLALIAGAAYAADDAPAAGTKPPASEVKPIPKEDKYVSHHSADIGGHSIGYTATFGNLVIKNDKDESVASMSYVAYVADGNKDTAHRPLTFLYNGGPGSSSIWLHMGAFGPKRVVTSDGVATPPPP